MKTRNKVLIGGAVVVIAYLLWKKNKDKKNLTASNVANGDSSSAPTNESSNLDLPTGMDLPNLTPSTSVPTEVAIKDSIDVVPTPAIVESKPTDTETALEKSNIIPIPKVTVPIAETTMEETPSTSILQSWINSGNGTTQIHTALPSTAPAISTIQEAPYSQTVKEMIPTYEGGSYQDAERS